MDAPRRALVIIDVQHDYAAGPLEIRFPPREESLPRIARAIDAATAARIPVIVVQHTGGVGSPIFDPETRGFALSAEVAERMRDDWKSVVKQHGSVYAQTDVAGWLRAQQVDTVTLIGFMTNNCVLATAVEGEGLGFTTEVLADATGAIDLANDAGFVDAETLHTTLLTLLASNFAAVASTDAWVAALEARAPLSRSDLGTSSVAGAERAGRHTA